MLLLAACAKHEPAPAPVASVPAPPPAASAVPDATAPDAIDRLVTKLAAEPFWENGGYPKIDLPETAGPAQVLGQVFSRISFDRGKATPGEIVRQRTVRIGNDLRDYTAVLLETSQGRKIALIQWQGAGVG